MIAVRMAVDKEATMANVTIEWAPFTLVDSADEARLLRASDALQEGFLAKQPGFIRRELLKGKDGQWVDLVYWESPEAAARAVQEAANSPVCFEYFRLMAGADHADPGNGVLHFEKRKTYGG
jgi:hypothetical protein